ncbi:protein adenylyltransferase SelO-like [Schistocerca piceifrons]|uniref:protein adenylyltransferase SelO-like n=1 Tax=Schistocerca piceifrons TaxID=274613 RepID=UPI001F5E3E88|nr:protein adenylyltransferase SelO-like [Schistocerca piceifrons]XP_047121439.1 protein adenylyltransferase SelO-like [Schistocerca piceifrons]
MKILLCSTILCVVATSITCDICDKWPKNYTHLVMDIIGRDTCPRLKRSLSEWQFSCSKLKQLPIDEIKENYVRGNVENAVFSEVSPVPLKTKLRLVSISRDALTDILDMDPEISDTEEFIQFIAGNKVLDSSTPLAHRYGGYQFGLWAYQLGDGRAVSLGEYVNSKGQHWELQLKGSGRTPYSRFGDGRAVLRSSVREFLCSEAMYYLGIPTSRAAALVVSEDPVVRDQFYKGYPKAERAAVVLRLAPSWFRFGSLEILTENGELATLKVLVDYIIQEYFPDLKDDKNKYVQMFSDIAYKSMDLAIHWDTVGFAHGVLNTDNMSLLGITIDYGPFGFVETYDPLFVPNSSDDEKRYALCKQLEIVRWNLEKLAHALSPLLNDDERSQILDVMNSLSSYSTQKRRQAFVRKLGLQQPEDSDDELITLLLQIMAETRADFTMTFRQFGEIDLTDITDKSKLDTLWSLEKLSGHRLFEDFIELYRNRVKKEKGLTEEVRKERILKFNPRYILRNWMAQVAIERAEDDDFTEVQMLHEILKNPFTVQEEAEKRKFADPPPEWSLFLRVSCSS